MRPQVRWGVVAGDFNLSVTVDSCWGKKPRRNQEIIDRLRDATRFLNEQIGVDAAAQNR